MRRSISPSSVSRRASSSAMRSDSAGSVSGVVAEATASVIVVSFAWDIDSNGSVFRHPDPALAHGVDHGLRPVVHGQLAKDRAHVVLDGLLADRQRVGDLLVGHALGDVVEDLDLARREWRKDRRRILPVDRELAELLEDARGDGGLREHLVVDEVLAADDTPDDRDEVVGTDVLEDERRGAGLDRVEEGVLVLRLGEHDDPAGRQLALDPLGRLDAARCREREVHQDDVGGGLERTVDGAARVVGFGDDLEVALVAEDVRDPHAKEGVIIDDEDPSDFAERAAVRPAASAVGAAVLHGTHVLSSPPVDGPVGIASRTTVPPSGRDRTSNRAPISSARSRMNWRPKLRRPRAATAPMSNPRPSSRTSRTQPSSSSRVTTATFVAAACLRTFCSASWATRRATVRWPSPRTAGGAVRSVVMARPVSVRMCSTVSVMAPSRPSWSRSGGRSWLMNARTSPSSRRSSSRR